MSEPKRVEIQDFALWHKKEEILRPLYSFDLELTARCNLNCRHCYINLPANDLQAKAAELSLEEIEKIADEAIKLGAMWVLLTGGEPLLRHDFSEIYLMLKRKGLLVSVFTNATLIGAKHINLFNKFPPRDIEVTIYGSRYEVYEAITRKRGSFSAFMRGLNLLMDAGVKVRLKAMALRSNLSDIESIAAFGQRYTKDFYRFDPMLHLRYDRDPLRNTEIKSERLTPEEIVSLERADQARTESMEKKHEDYFIEAFKHRVDNHLFHCGTGNGSFTVGYDGSFRLCSSLFAPGTTINLHTISLGEAWKQFAPKVKEMQTENSELINNCDRCPIVNLWMNCPAHAYLETGNMEAVVPYFCQVAHARAEALEASLLKA